MGKGIEHHIFLFVAFMLAFLPHLCAYSQTMFVQDAVTNANRFYGDGLYEKALDVFTNFPSDSLIADPYILREVYLVKGKAHYKLVSYNESKVDLDKSLRYSRAASDTASLIHADILYTYANLCQDMCNYQQAMRYHHQALDIRMANEEGNDVSKSLNHIANLHRDLGEYRIAEQTFEKVIELRKQLNGEMNQDVANSYINLTSLYLDMGEYAKADSVIRLAEAIYGKMEMMSHPKYATLLRVKAKLLVELSDYEGADSLYHCALSLYEKVYGEDNSLCIGLLSNLADLYYRTNQFSQSLNLHQKVLAKRRVLYGDQHSSVASTLISIAQLNYKAGRYDDAIEYAKQAIGIYKELNNILTREYANALYLLANVYQDLGNYKVAEQLHLEALDIKKQVLGEEHPDYASSLSHIGNLYRDLGDYLQSESYLRRALDIRISLYGKRHPDYAKSLNNLAALYIEQHVLDKAQQILAEAIEVLHDVYGVKNLKYVTALRNLANVNKECGQYEIARKMYNDVLDLYQSIVGDDHVSTLGTKFNLGCLEMEVGNHKESIAVFEELLGRQERCLGQYHPAYSNTLRALAEAYNKVGLYRQSFDAYAHLYKIQTFIIQENFSFLSDRQKMHYWETRRELFEKEIPDICLKNKDRPEACTLFYDNALMMKGILLNSADNVFRQIYDFSSEECREALKTLKMKKEHISLLLEQPIVKQTALSQLRFEADVLEKMLRSKNALFMMQSDYFAIKWQDIASELQRGECSIEFVALGNVLYAAIVFNGCVAPQIFKVYETNDSQSTNGLQCAEEISNVLFNQLSQYMESPSIIYFSPSGMLHHVPFENCADFISEVSMVRLSSTRQLRLHRIPTHSFHAEVYGGLYYSEDISDNSSCASNRAGFSYLSGTKYEVENICNLMDKLSVSYNLYTKEEGTETSFYQLDPKQVKVLHLATHGFFLPKQSFEYSRLRNYLGILQDSNISDIEQSADQSMLRCGLLLSGAEYAMRNSEEFEKNSDGIVTAKDIGCCNFQGLELVVLSACETGLGDVNGSEGVFGLQRGFKQAGAQTILMSLWQVDDLATQMLMVEFYKHFLKGESKKESLYKAQQYVQTQKGFESPFYWAGFILLDALD